MKENLSHVIRFLGVMITLAAVCTLIVSTSIPESAMAVSFLGGILIYHCVCC